MEVVRYLLPAVAVLFLTGTSASGQTLGEIGTWQYMEGGGAEAIYTQSTDADRTFTLAVNCENGKPAVTLEYVLAYPGDDFGLDPDRFGTEARLAIWLDSKKVDATSWFFSPDSEWFVTDREGQFLDKLTNSETMRMRLWDANGTRVGTYRFNLSGVESALGTLSCYQRG